MSRDRYDFGHFSEQRYDKFAEPQIVNEISYNEQRHKDKERNHWMFAASFAWYGDLFHSFLLSMKRLVLKKNIPLKLSIPK